MHCPVSGVRSYPSSHSHARDSLEWMQIWSHTSESRQWSTSTEEEKRVYKKKQNVQCFVYCKGDYDGFSVCYLQWEKAFFKNILNIENMLLNTVAHCFVNNLGSTVQENVNDFLPSQCVSWTNLIPLGQSQMKPNGRSTHRWEQPPFSCSHSFRSTQTQNSV